jgi:hypothetical protein
MIRRISRSIIKDLEAERDVRLVDLGNGIPPGNDLTNQYAYWVGYLKAMSESIEIAKEVEKKLSSGESND